VPNLCHNSREHILKLKKNFKNIWIINTNFLLLVQKCKQIKFYSKFCTYGIVAIMYIIKKTVLHQS